MVLRLLIFFVLLSSTSFGQSRILDGTWCVTKCDVSNTTAPQWLKENTIQESLSTNYTFKSTDSLNYVHIKSNTLDNEGDWIMERFNLVHLYMRGELNGFDMKYTIMSYDNNFLVFRIPVKEGEYILETLKKIP